MGLKIVADSSCDLTGKEAEEYDIDIVPFYISYGDDTYYKDFYELDTDTFYQTLKDKNCCPKTSMPTFDDYYSVFKAHAEKGDDIICICLTGKFSGSYSCAVSVKEQIVEEYPNIAVEVINSTTTCIMQGLLAIEARKLSRKGYGINEIAERINMIKEHSGAVITVDSLIYLQRGGRIGKVSSIAGDLLSIKPIILVTDGELLPHSKIRTRKKAKEKIIELAVEMTKDFAPENVTFFALNTAARDEAEELGKRFAEKIQAAHELETSVLGCTIGAHIGPSVVGIGFFVNE